MEIIGITVLSVFISWLYLSYAPMHEIKDAVFHAENMANQKQKYERS